MNIVVAKNAGFCFGVRRATETLERAISEGVGKIYTYGDVIHNRQYLDKLASLGVKSISGAEIDAIAAGSTASSPSTVVIRAHGIERDEEMKLRLIEASNPYFHVLDCTCPFVSKVHRIAEKETGENTVFFLIGSASHPEVKGIMSWAVGEKHVFPNADCLESFIISQNDEKLSAKCVVLAAQTTQKLSEWKKCQKIVQTHYTNRKIFDTICSVTEDRQREAASLAPTVDAMLVIGGADSSNTNKLCDVCREACPRTYRIETADDIPTEIIGTLYKIGITAGASTPDGIIEEVKTKMADIETNKSFEELIDESLKTINSGDIVTGTVTSVSGTEVHLDIGGKTTGIITADQFSDDPSAKLSDLVKVGDEVKAFVIKNSDIDGIAMLSKRRVDSDASWFAMEENAKNGAIIEGKISEAVKSGLVMMVNGVRVFIPASLSGVPRNGDLTALVGTTQKVKIKEVDVQKKRAYGSIRDAARAERKAREEAFWSTAEIGKWYTGTVKNITVYGVFVEIAPGIEGMIHISELTWKHIRHPSEVVAVGDTIDTYIIDMNRSEHRISLGCKTEETNPWRLFTEKYSVGDVAKVKIVSFTPFGAFAEIVPGQDGLIHISEISRERIAKPSDVLTLGSEVDVKIIAVDEEKHKVSLSIKALGAFESAHEEKVEKEDNSDGVVYSTDAPEQSVYTVE